LRPWACAFRGEGGAFEGVAGFAGAGGFAPASGFAPALPTVKYLRIFSRRFGPMPRMALKSSTLLNAPYDLRICKIFSAVTGPMPGTNCSSSDVAVFKLTGAAGGFFFADARKGDTDKARRTAQVRAAERNAGDRLNMRPTITNPVLIRINNYRGQSSRLPWASKISSSPNNAACDSICARSPTTTICKFAESRYLRDVSSKSLGVSARTFWRYVSR